MIRRLYDWVIRLAQHKNAIPAMGVVSFMESSFFPIPPDVMLVPMVLANRDKAFKIALVCTVCSVLGGLLGYAIGYFFFETLGAWVVKTYGLQSGPCRLSRRVRGVRDLVHPDQGPDADPLQAGDHRFRRRAFRPVHVRVGVHLDAWPPLLPRGRLAVEVRRADPGLHREAPGAAHLALPVRPDRRVRRRPLSLLGSLHGRYAAPSPPQPARPHRPTGQRRRDRRRPLLPVRDGLRAVRDVSLAALAAHRGDGRRASRPSPRRAVRASPPPSW